MIFSEAKEFILTEFGKINPMKNEGLSLSYMNMSTVILRALKPKRYDYITRSRADCTKIILKDNVAIVAVDFFELDEEQIVNLASAVKIELREHKLLMLD